MYLNLQFYPSQLTYSDPYNTGCTSVTLRGMKRKWNPLWWWRNCIILFTVLRWDAAKRASLLSNVLWCRCVFAPFWNLKSTPTCSFYVKQKCRIFCGNNNSAPALKLKQIAQEVTHVTGVLCNSFWERKQHQQLLPQQGKKRNDADIWSGFFHPIISPT